MPQKSKNSTKKCAFEVSKDFQKIIESKSIFAIICLIDDMKYKVENNILFGGFINSNGFKFAKELFPNLKRITKNNMNLVYQKTLDFLKQNTEINKETEFINYEKYYSVLNK
jgi:hypothetical protein